MRIGIDPFVTLYLNSKNRARRILKILSPKQRRACGFLGDLSDVQPSFKCGRPPVVQTLRVFRPEREADPPLAESGFPKSRTENVFTLPEPDSFRSAVARTEFYSGD